MDEEIKEVKKERPQNRNLKPLGTGSLTPEEELAIRRKGIKAAQEARSRNASIRKAIRAYANLNSNGKGKSIDAEKMVSLEQLAETGAPMIMLLADVQWKKALTGDNEARDWLCRHGLIDEEEIRNAIRSAAQAQGLTVTADADALEQPGGVRIHLIRGEKPQTEESPEDLATRAADRMAVVEAMRAIGEAVAEGQADAETVSEGE